MYHIISISGNEGSGKSTVAQTIAEKINAERIYVGGIRRELAREKGMSIHEFNAYGLTNPETDVDVDKKAQSVVREAADKGHVIAEGRVMFHFLPESIKFYIKVDPQEGVRRIWNHMQSGAQRNEKIQSLEELAAKTVERNASDVARYQKYYNIDHTDENHYDYVIDTTNLTQEEVVESILSILAENHGFDPF